MSGNNGHNNDNLFNLSSKNKVLTKIRYLNTNIVINKYQYNTGE